MVASEQGDPVVRVFYPGRDPEPAPRLRRELRMDQLEAIYRITREITDPDRSGSVLVGAGMGSGKTVVSVEVILKTKPKRCLIVGVRDAYGQWRDALADQQADLPVRARRVMKRINGTEPGLKNLQKLLDGDPGVFYIGLEMLRHQDWEGVSETYAWAPEIKAMFGDAIGERTDPVKSMKQKHTYKNMDVVDLLISDESHKHSNQKTASIKTIREIPTHAKIALSGTFYGNRFENAWTLATWLWGKPVIGTKGAFEANYCNKIPIMSKDGRTQIKTRSGFPLSKIVGERQPGEYVETLPCYVFIATPIGDVPPPEVVEVDLLPEQVRQYEQMESQSLTWIPSTASKGHEPLIADIPVVQRGRLRTAALGGMTLVPGADPEADSDSITFEPGCKSNKLNAAYDVLHRPTWVGKKALILTHSKPFAKEVARRIGQKYSVALKTGDTPSKVWDEGKRRFMLPVSETDSVQYCVAVISAVGTATDGLQVNCAKVLWLSEDDNPTNNLQASNRVWRDGVNLEEYEAVKLVSRGTIDENVLHKNAASVQRILDSVAGLR